MHPRNPFYILELGPAASPGDIERQGRKLLGLLEVGASKARAYTCPLGTFPRDDTMVRESMAALRDPHRRARESCLASLLEGVTEAEDRDPDAPLADAFLAGGYRGL